MSDTTALATRPDSPPTISEGPGALLSAIVQMARDPSVDADKLEKLLAMQERMEARDAERQFNVALMRLPAIHVKKNGMIDLTSKEDRAKSVQRKPVPFAKWEDMAAVIEPLLEPEGFRLSFDSAPRPGEGGGLIVTGTLLHRAGHSRSASMSLALDTGPGRNNLQAQGSTLSYGKRYTTEMLLNIVRDGDDDDGKKGGTKFITEQEAAELRHLMEEVGRQEAPFLERLFAGAVHSVEEIEAGSGYLAAKSTLEGIKQQQARKV
jgi:ERF superfamily